jgi:hypothetical protein
VHGPCTVLSELVGSDYQEELGGDFIEESSGEPPSEEEIP